MLYWVGKQLILEQSVSLLVSYICPLHLHKISYPDELAGVAQEHLASVAYNVAWNKLHKKLHERNRKF